MLPFFSKAMGFKTHRYPAIIYLYHVEKVNPDSKILIEVVQTKMPYGKYKGTLISDLPVYYLEWLHSKGLPAGKLGMLLGTAYEIKINGLTSILTLVKKSLSENRL